MKVSPRRTGLLVLLSMMVVGGSAGRAQTEPVAPPQPTTAPIPQSSQPVRDENGTYTIRSAVPLVVLDVVVTDAKGKPVKDLQRADFHVREATDPQTILSFEEAGTRVPDAAVQIDSTAELDKLAPQAPVQILVLDEFNTRFEDMAFARYSLKKFLEKQPGRLATPTILISVDLEKFQVLHDYTQDKDEIIKALDHHFVAYPWRLKSEWVGERYATAFMTLRRVAQAVMGHPGHKNMIWIGRGFPPYNFANAPVDSQTRINSAVQDCVNTLRDARITLYTIDPAGVIVDAQKYGSAAAFNDPFGGDYQFSHLAKATGGASLFGHNDVDAEIDTAIQDGASFYTLTYRPTNTARDPKQFRKIQVTVDRPGTTVLTREGYYLQYGPGRVDPKKMPKRIMSDLAAADTSKMTYDGVPITVEPTADDPEAFLVHLDGKGMVWTNATATEPRHADFILIVSTFDKKGVELKKDARVFKVNAAADVEPTGRLDHDVDIKYHLDPNAKTVRARFTVRVNATGRIGAVDAVVGKK